MRLNTSQPGFGLGLATVKRLVEAHAGRLGVESVPGQGSLFWFELPRTPELQPSPTAPSLTTTETTTTSTTMVTEQLH